MVKTPCARDRTSGKIVFAPTAYKKRKHACLECASDVVVHRGSKRVPHFTHLVPIHGRGGCGGGGESVLHRTTKEWIKSIANDPPFVIWTRCSSCSATFDVFRGSAETKAITECRVHSYVVDVALHSHGRISGFVEVFHTHATSEQKRAALEATAGWACPVMEVKAVNLVDTGFQKRFECVSLRRCTPCITTAIGRRRSGMFERYAVFFRAALRAFRVRHLIEAMLVEDAIKAVAAATEAVARKWLLVVRAKSLAVRLRCELFAPCVVCDAQARKHDDSISILVKLILRCGEDNGADVSALKQPGWYCSKQCIQERVPFCITCYKPNRQGKWCACKRALMAKCTGCSKWGSKSTMHAILPGPRGKWFDLAHTECTKTCIQCPAPFIVDPDCPYYTKCFRCNYKNKNGTCWSPFGDGNPDGACTVCGKYIRSIRYNHTCFACNNKP